jgi:hypothetical protein
VVAVSEETGAISYAYKGQLVRGVSLEELRAFLTSVLVPRARSRSWIEWIRVHATERVAPAPAVVAKSSPPSANSQNVK